MGTYYAEKYSRKTDGCELANLTHPADVKAVHLEYLRAGCDAVKTNTFGASSAPLDFGDGERVRGRGLRRLLRLNVRCGKAQRQTGKNAGKARQQRGFEE